MSVYRSELPGIPSAYTHQLLGPRSNVAMPSLQTGKPEPEKTLVSWKEIASFLDRAERTVKRWERQRGLPVHRVPGGERGSVYAYPSELTIWLRGKSSELEQDELAAGELESNGSLPIASPDSGLSRPADYSGRIGKVRLIRFAVIGIAAA